MSQKAFVRIYKSDELIEVKGFTNDQIIIGSGSSVQVRLEDEQASPIHALIEKRHDNYYICDLGSKSGTAKNGKTIIDEILVSSDRVEIGKYSLEFYLGENKPVSIPPNVLSEVIPAIPAEKVDDSSGNTISSFTKSGLTPKPILPSMSSLGTGVGGGANSGKTNPKFVNSQITSSGIYNHRRRFSSSQGAVVEVVVSWKDRVLETYHFSDQKEILLGGHDQCDIYLPVFGNRNIQHKLLKIGKETEVYLAPQMTGELLTSGRSESFAELVKSGRFNKIGSDYSVFLNQGEVLSLDIPNSQLTIHIRFVSNTAIPIMAPILDLSVSELTGLVMSVFIAIFLSFYIAIKVSKTKEDLVELAQPKRIARFVYKEIVPPPVQVKKIKTEIAPPIKVDKVALEKKVKIKRPPGKIKKKIGKIARIRPKNLPKAPKKLTSIRKGSAKKIAKKSGASAATVKKDISKVGVLGIFGNNGYRNKLDKASSGVGVLQGLAAKAKGGAGENENLEGEKIGRALIDTGRGGQGLSTIGIETIGTKGRASGNQGYGEGGLGGKSNVSIQFGDEEAEFVGRIDKEAIRRVIKSHLRQITNCYESALNRRPGLSGKLVLEWEIGDKGLVSKAKVKSSTLNSPRAEKCLVRRLRTWRFPETPAGQVGLVDYPFVFQQQN